MPLVLRIWYLLILSHKTHNVILLFINSNNQALLIQWKSFSHILLIYVMSLVMMYSEFQINALQ